MQVTAVPRPSSGVWNLSQDLRRCIRPERKNFELTRHANLPACAMCIGVYMQNACGELRGILLAPPHVGCRVGE